MLIILHISHFEKKKTIKIFKNVWHAYAHTNTHALTHRPHLLRHTITSNNNNCNTSWTTSTTTTTTAPLAQQPPRQQQQQPQTTPLPPPPLLPPPLPPLSWAITHWKWARSGRRTRPTCFHWYFSVLFLHHVFLRFWIVPYLDSCVYGFPYSIYDISLLSSFLWNSNWVCLFCCMLLGVRRDPTKDLRYKKIVLSRTC